MAELASGQMRKMITALDTPVRYHLPVGEGELDVNALLESPIQLRFDGMITCVECGRKTKKSFNQGYCYPCFSTKAACDRCIVRPELCHFAAGTCREPEWGQRNCNIDHFVYLANSSGVKVGITRHSQIPTRWIDQGAAQALPLFRVSTRHQSGVLEVAFKDHVADKTHWQRMLKGAPQPVDMKARRDELLPRVAEQLTAFEQRFGESSVEQLSSAEVTDIAYPVVSYPEKVKSLSLDKQEIVEGTLLGVKGQYLILDTGVINLRKFGGYHVTVAA